MIDVLSGVYENINSPIHNINAKYKIPCFLAMIILTLAAKSYVVYIIDFLILAICILISKLNIKHFISAISKLWFFYLTNITFKTITAPCLMPSVVMLIFQRLKTVSPLPKKRAFIKNIVK